jgi:hypothetical protein
MRRVISFVFLIALNVPLSAIDLPYGSDALPHLSADASLIVEAMDAVDAEIQTEEAQSFRVRIRSVVRGDAPGDVVLVINPVSEERMDASIFTSSVLFLAGPLDEMQRAEWRIAAFEPVFQLVAGEGGVVRLTPARREAIEQYVAVPDEGASKHGFQWANEYLLHGDPFLQRSAIFQLDRHDDERRAIDSLGRAAKSPQVELENRALAVQVIASSGLPHAFELLKTIAERKDVRIAIRVSSVEAIEDLPGGAEQLRKWTKSADGMLKTAALRAIVSAGNAAHHDQ